MLSIVFGYIFKEGISILQTVNSNSPVYCIYLFIYYHEQHSVFLGMIRELRVYLINRNPQSAIVNVIK